jgi:DNA-binding NtrC family response regulator
VGLVTIDGQLQRIIDELVSKGVPLEAAKREFEKKYVSAAVDRAYGNMGVAAKTLGIHRNTLRTKISLLKVKPVRSRRDDT